MDSKFNYLAPYPGIKTYKNGSPSNTIIVYLTALIVVSHFCKSLLSRIKPAPILTSIPNSLVLGSRGLHIDDIPVDNLGCL